ncbi:porin [Variovorax fucosicus]|uniref:porin n=1 Tax=Variovorax fucosicus TaxID=3053517 RepID=UPI002577841F|nr:porin [Variovorax sp. J22G47]MDM0055866.1 porin [Variovorax sp. J22G47]
MKKTIVAAAVLSCAGAASAQSSVTLFGAMDAGISYYSATSSFYNNTARPVAPAPDVTRSQTALSSSGTTPSRLGFRGTEDLGGGLAASFWLEAGLANDAGLGAGPGGAFAFNRRSTVSFSGPFGEVRLGRDYTPTYWNDAVFSPFSTLGVGTNVVSAVGSNLQVAKGPGSAMSATDNYMRTGNSIGYFLPPGLGGFYGQFQYALHENVGQGNVPGTPSSKGRFAGGRFGYAAGALDVAAAYGESTAADTTAVSAAGLATGARLSEKIKTFSIGASYNFDAFKLFGELSHVRDVSRSTAPIAGVGALTTRESDKYKGGLVGVTVPLGAGLFKTSYSWVKFDNDLGPLATPFAPGRDASVRKLAVGYEYNLSKRTALYATVARIRVKDGQNNPAIMGAIAGAAATYASTGAGTSGYAPSRSTGYDFGMRHAF